MVTRQADTSANRAERRIYASQNPLAQAAVEQVKALYQIRNLLIAFLVLSLLGAVAWVLFGVVVPALSVR